MVFSSFPHTEILKKQASALAVYEMFFKVLKIGRICAFHVVLAQVFSDIEELCARYSD